MKAEELISLSATSETAWVAINQNLWVCNWQKRNPAPTVIDKMYVPNQLQHLKPLQQIYLRPWNVFQYYSSAFTSPWWRSSVWHCTFYPSQLHKPFKEELRLLVVFTQCPAPTLASELCHPWSVLCLAAIQHWESWVQLCSSTYRKTLNGIDAQEN